MNITYDPKEQTRVVAAREGFSGRMLTDPQFDEAMAITGIMEREINRSGKFKEKLGDYSYAFARSEKFDVMKAETIIRDLFKERTGMTMNKMREALVKGLRRDLVRLDKKINDFLERIVETINMATINAYERKITQLENEKLLKAEKLQKSTQQKASRSQMLEHSLQFLSNPWKLWVSGNINLQKTVLRLAFLERLPYYRNEGYRTPKTSLPFNVLAGISGDNLEVVPHR